MNRSILRVCILKIVFALKVEAALETERQNSLVSVNPVICGNNCYPGQHEGQFSAETDEESLRTHFFSKDEEILEAQIALGEQQIDRAEILRESALKSIGLGKPQGKEEYMQSIDILIKLCETPDTPWFNLRRARTKLEQYGLNDLIVGQCLKEDCSKITDKFEEVDKSIEKTKENIKSQISIGNSVEQRIEAESQSARKQIAEAKMQRKQGNSKEAKNILDCLIQSQSTPSYYLSEAHFLLSQFYFSAGKIDKAAEMLNIFLQNRYPLPWQSEVNLFQQKIEILKGRKKNRNPILITTNKDSLKKISSKKSVARQSGGETYFSF